MATLSLVRARSRCDGTVAVGEVVEVINNTLKCWGARDLWRYIRNAFFIVLLLVAVAPVRPSMNDRLCVDR